MHFYTRIYNIVKINKLEILLPSYFLSSISLHQVNTIEKKF